jgi:quinol monooxygenase YgiN
MLTIIAEIAAKPGKEAALHEALLTLIEPTRKEAGCVEYYLHQSTVEQGRFFFYENWASQEAFQQHMESAHLGAVAARLEELTAEEPRILTLVRIA